MCCAHTRTHIHTHMQTQTLCALQSETLHVFSLRELISCNSPPARVLVGHRPTTWIPVKRTVWAKGESIWEGSRLSSFFKKTETTAAKKSISYPGFLVFQTRIIFWKKSSEHKLYGGCFSSSESRACVCFLLSLSTLCTTRVLRHISDQSTAITPRPFRICFFQFHLQSENVVQQLQNIVTLISFGGLQILHWVNIYCSKKLLLWEDATLFEMKILILQRVEITETLKI